MELPKYIIKALASNKTSLGEHPSYPPEDEEKFAVKLITKYFDIITEKYGDISEQDLQHELSDAIAKCKKIEANHTDVLEQLCVKIITELFDIPEDILNIEVNLVNHVNSDNQRMIPEKTEDYSFEDINDINYLTDEIYKRRLLNALVSGAALNYANIFTKYLSDIFDIDSELASLYKKILDYNRILLYLTKDTLSNDENTSMDGGKVDVMISSEDFKVTIKAEALLFPILVEETIRGILELAASHGLPKDKSKANYVISKSDFKLAELWDSRLGLPLWDLIENTVKNCGYDTQDIGVNFLIMSIAELQPNDFNNLLQEVFAITKKGKSMMSNIIEHILQEKERDDFDDYMSQNNDKYQINDDDYFEPEDLIVEN
jgi:hypothetical protein